MIRYRIIHPVSQVLWHLAIKLDSVWLERISGSLELYADECAFAYHQRRRTPTSNQ